jgi:hypothetical protein
MLQFNGARLKIMQGLPSPFDYAEFVRRCTVQSIPPLGLGEYAQKVGMVLCAEHLFPGSPLADAYTLFVKKMNQEHTERQAGVSGCSSCGDKGVEPTDEPPTPNTINLLKNAGTAVSRWLQAGAKNVSSKEREERMSVCQRCAHLMPMNRCRLCGCFVKLKTWMATETCPEGKWA